MTCILHYSPVNWIYEVDVGILSQAYLLHTCYIRCYCLKATTLDSQSTNFNHPQFFYCAFGRMKVYIGPITCPSSNHSPPQTERNLQAETDRQEQAERNRQTKADRQTETDRRIEAGEGYRGIDRVTQTEQRLDLVTTLRNQSVVYNTLQHSSKCFDLRLSFTQKTNTET